VHDLAYVQLLQLIWGRCGAVCVSSLMGLVVCMCIYVCVGEQRKSEWKKGRFKRLDDVTEAQLVEDQRRLFEEAARTFQEKEATEYAKEADLDMEDLKDEDDPCENDDDDDDDDEEEEEDDAAVEKH
jgi:hypothetical protein